MTLCRKFGNTTPSQSTNSVANIFSLLNQKNTSEDRCYELDGQTRPSGGNIYAIIYRSSIGPLNAAQLFTRNGSDAWAKKMPQ